MTVGPREVALTHPKNLTAEASMQMRSGRANTI